MFIQVEVQLAHCTALLDPYTHIPRQWEEEGGKDKKLPSLSEGALLKPSTAFQLASQRPELSHMATLGTKEIVKYMVVVNPGSDSEEEGIMGNETHSLPHVSRCEVFRISN